MAVSEAVRSQLIAKLRNPRNLYLTFGIAIGIGYVSTRAFQNYRKWMALGAGGVPANPLGWSLNWLLRAVAGDADTTSTSIYTNPKVVKRFGATASKNYLSTDLPQRQRERPTVPGYAVVPQRQVTQKNSVEMMEIQKQRLADLVRRIGEEVELKDSVLERHGAAIFLRDTLKVPKFFAVTQGEICHFHAEAEGSGHVTLSLADARLIIERGWGERHILSRGTGSVRLIHPNYVMVYAPQNEAELETVISIFDAGIRYFINSAVY